MKIVLDTHNGKRYSSVEEALEKGALKENIAEVRPETVIVTYGPFKGRRYLYVNNRFVRLSNKGAICPTSSS